MPGSRGDDAPREVAAGQRAGQHSIPRLQMHAAAVDASWGVNGRDCTEESREQRIREERQLTSAREVRGLVVVQHELNQPSQKREWRGSGVLVCGFEQRPRPRRHHASLGEQLDDPGD